MKCHITVEITVIHFQSILFCKNFVKPTYLFTKDIDEIVDLTKYYLVEKMSAYVHTVLATKQKSPENKDS